LIGGREVQPVFELRDANLVHYAPAVAWSGEEFVLAWARTLPSINSPNYFPPSASTLLVRRISRRGELRDAEPLAIPRNAYASGLRAVSTASGVALGWIEGRLIFGTILVSAPVVRAWSFDAPFDLGGFDLAPRPGGGVLLLWNARWTPQQSFLALRQIDAAGAPEGDADIVQQSDANTRYGSLAVAGAQVFIAYERRIDGPAAGGVQRIVVRATGAPRNRAVR